MKNLNSKGFTLIELMIVVVVVAIIATIAIPAYNGYVERARRADAKSGLLALQLSQEKHRANCPTYASGFRNTPPADPADYCTDNLIVFKHPSDDLRRSPDQFYDLAIDDSGSFNYQISADPIGKQSNDDCGEFVITVTAADGEVYTAENGNDADCWQR